MQEDYLHKVIGAIYDAGHDTSAWFAVLKEIEVLLHANNTHLLVTDRQTGVPIFGMVSRYPEANGEYITEYAQIDERWPRILQLPHATPTRHEELLLGDEIRTSPTYNEFLVKYGAQSQTITRMDGPEGSSVVFSAIRDWSAGAFDATETETLRLVLPHILRAVQIQWRLRQSEIERDAGLSALDHLPHGIVLAGPDGTAVRTNRAAEEVLRQNDGLTISHGRLATRRAADDAELSRLLASAARQGTGDVVSSGGVMAVRRPSGKRPYTLLVAPLGRRESAEFLGVGGQRPSAMVFVSDPAAIPVVPAERLRQLFRLTPAEANVVSALANGISPHEYAEQINRSKETVRVHLKSAMAKTDTHSQTELVRLILSVMSPGPRAANGGT